jgi:hypothetical protein
MITNVEELKSEFLRRGIARKEDLIGCEDRELDEIEQQYGTLPLAYKQIMKCLGGGDRKWLALNGYEDFDLARARGLSQWMKEGVFLTDENGVIISELDHVLFISGYYAEFGGGIQFIKTGQDSIDSVVYCIDMAYSNADINEWLETIEVYSNSIWGWIEGYLSIAEKQMLRAKPNAVIEVNHSFWQKLFGK